MAEDETGCVSEQKCNRPFNICTHLLYDFLSGDRLHDFDISLAKNSESPEQEQCAHYQGAMSSGATETMHCNRVIYGRY